MKAGWNRPWSCARCRLLKGGAGGKTERGLLAGTSSVHAFFLGIFFIPRGKRSEESGGAWWPVEEEFLPALGRLPEKAALDSGVGAGVVSRRGGGYESFAAA